MRINPYTTDYEPYSAAAAARRMGEDLVLFFSRADQFRPHRQPNGWPGQEWVQIATRIELLDDKGRLIEILKDRDGPTGPVPAKVRLRDSFRQWIRSRHPWRITVYMLITFMLFLPLYKAVEAAAPQWANVFYWGFILWMIAPDKRGAQKWRP